MKLSKLFFHTSKTSQENQISSYKFMIKAGYIKPIGAGIYQFAPIMQKVIKNLERIVREEMNKISSNEVDLCQMHPAELWQRSGRLEIYEKEGVLLTCKSRSDKKFCLAPTAEEGAIHLMNNWIDSYKNLPVSFYQINNKFRDEIRPKNGLMRSKIFIMKDAYTFAEDWKSAKEEYYKMKEAYSRIMNRIGIDGVFVSADSGSIGGSFSEEFQAFVKDIGDEIIITDRDRGYNIEVARSELSWFQVKDKQFFKKEGAMIHTPGLKKIQEVAKHLNVHKSRIVKTSVYFDKENNTTVLALSRGDRKINEFKLCKYLSINNVVRSNTKSLEELGIIPGFIGPVSKEGIRIIADISLKYAENIIVGANIVDYHKYMKNLNDFEIKYADIDLSQVDDICVDGGKFVKLKRASEVGHIFILGKGYSETMDSTFTSRNGSKEHFSMGCYGIGISRLAAVYVEQNNDEHGIIWSKSIAPYLATILYFPSTEEVALDLYNKINKNDKILLDDRKDKNFGQKIKDSNLIGIPYKIILGVKFENENLFEVEDRFGNKTMFESIEDVKHFIYG